MKGGQRGSPRNYRFDFISTGPSQAMPPSPPPDIVPCTVHEHASGACYRGHSGRLVIWGKPGSKEVKQLELRPDRPIFAFTCRNQPAKIPQSNDPPSPAEALHRMTSLRFVHRHASQTDVTHDDHPDLFCSEGSCQRTSRFHRRPRFTAFPPLTRMFVGSLALRKPERFRLKPHSLETLRNDGP